MYISLLGKNMIRMLKDLFEEYHHSINCKEKMKMQKCQKLGAWPMYKVYNVIVFYVLVIKYIEEKYLIQEYDS